MLWNAIGHLVVPCSILDDVGAAVSQGLGDVLKLSFAKVWTSLEITFLFEHFLLELRHLAFEGKSHLCKAVWPSSHTLRLTRSGCLCLWLP